jgi:hypothetical protein
MTSSAAEIYDTWATIYKYRAFNHDAISILVDHELYFASPQQLNDPHDCQIDVAAALNEALTNFDLEVAPPDRKATLIEAAKELRKDPSIADRIQRMIDSQSVCSFSILPDNALMWAHYADAHRGFCLGFDPKLIRERIDEGFDNVIPCAVLYTDGNPFSPTLHMFVNAVYASYPPAKPSTYSLYRFVATSAVSTKSLAWSYEKEFRYVRIKGRGVVKFPPIALVEVVLGCNMYDRDRKTLLNLLKTREWTHVQLREVRKSPTSFSFEIVDL